MNLKNIPKTVLNKLPVQQCKQTIKNYSSYAARKALQTTSNFASKHKGKIILTTTAAVLSIILAQHNMIKYRDAKLALIQQRKKAIHAENKRLDSFSHDSPYAIYDLEQDFKPFTSSELKNKVWRIGYKSKNKGMLDERVKNAYSSTTNFFNRKKVKKNVRNFVKVFKHFYKYKHIKKTFSNIDSYNQFNLFAETGQRLNFTWPVNYSNVNPIEQFDVTSPYEERFVKLGKRRERKDRHSGIDISSFYDKDGKRVKVVAAESGIVGKVRKIKGLYSLYYTYVTIIHPNGFTTHYGHVANIKVKEGQHVKKGQHIAGIGLHGMTSGAHLHFKIKRHGRTISPELALYPRYKNQITACNELRKNNHREYWALKDKRPRSKMKVLVYNKKEHHSAGMR